MFSYTIEPLYFQSEQEIIAADFYRPKLLKTPAVIVMAHGLAAERSFGLAVFAKRFAQAGYAVVVFDYRNFGGSTGKPRGLVSIRQQLQDWENVLLQLQKRRDINTRKVVLWGTSLSGGHVLSLAPQCKYVQAVITQVPYIDGQESLKIYPKKYLTRLSRIVAKDFMSKQLGLEPHTIAVIAESGIRCFASPDSYSGFLSIVPQHVERIEEIPARIMFSLSRYRPILAVRKITVPVCLLAATQDQIVPIEITRLCVTNLAPFVQYHEFPVGHFDVYHGQWFEKNISMQIDFLHQHIGVES
ncbi:alpha/beta hydrolase [Acinetobacter puyangensis]|uniref:Lysophospholipase, alpha-beta hydrolase superfamily n=1 Tax=Acinetobacter puyangensis TaxID=1096779 RepID=A0A240E8S9_9GAMM|nr:alpha/beta fold hydrolase [Acinetobacter puyangensis]SNX44653.1 Lysophospholipase, alpha-beta hydrolase superfamily [Acinetobacter puyangensis]